MKYLFLFFALVALTKCNTEESFADQKNVQDALSYLGVEIEKPGAIRDVGEWVPSPVLDFELEAQKLVDRHGMVREQLTLFYDGSGVIVFSEVADFFALEDGAELTVHSVLDVLRLNMAYLALIIDAEKRPKTTRI